MKKLLYDLINGLKTLAQKPLWLVATVIYIAVITSVLLARYALLAYSPNTLLASILDIFVYLVYVMLLIIGVFLIGELSTAPFNNLSMNKMFQGCGLKNKLDEVPTVKSFTETKASNKKTLLFDTEGIPLSQWDNLKESIESALNIRITDMYYAVGTRILAIEFVPATNAIPTSIKWSDNYLFPDKEAFPLTLGISLTGPTYVNLGVQNSILIGGSTGSGKTILLKNLIYQAHELGAVINIIDLKGGVDFSASYWHENCTIVTTKEEASKLLDEAIEVMKKRKELFLREKVTDIADYNGYHRGNELPRIIIACDEVASLLDTKGLPKEEKVATIELSSKLSALARLGRAFGIHLILATQRPDADVLDGQIKNNIDCRICGRADQVLSRIILDNTDASAYIPKNSRGRFLTSDGIEFQGFYQKFGDDS